METNTVCAWRIKMTVQVSSTISMGLSKLRDEYTELSNLSPDTELWKTRLKEIETAYNSLFVEG